MRKRYYLALPLFALLALFATGCVEKDVTATADTTVCVYDGGDDGGQRFKFQLLPNSDSKKTTADDDVVTIPASNRFFFVSTNGSLRDPLAPEFYPAFASDGVRVKVEGQVRFRFNIGKACEWYAKHGRRNEPLNFNARGSAGQNAGWLKFLSENFGVTMSEIMTEETTAFSWQKLVYNYPINADESGRVSGEKKGESTWRAFGELLGKRFSERLTANLGGDYFCGVENNATGIECPPMSFQISRVTTEDEALMNARAQEEKTRQALESQERTAEIRARTTKKLLQAEADQQRLLRAKQVTARLRALSSAEVARCIALARAGLDCHGYSLRAPIIYGSGNGLPSVPDSDPAPEGE